MSQKFWLRITSFDFNLCEEMIESGDDQCKGVSEVSAGVYYVKKGSAGETPYVHWKYPNENTWVFYWYTGVDKDFEIDFTFEK